MRPNFQHGPIHNVLVDFGVSAVIRGHDHLYHCGIKDGIIYLTLPQPSVPHELHSVKSEGGPNEDFAASKGYKLGELDWTSGYAEVSVNALEVDIAVKSATSDTLIHELKIFPQHNQLLQES